MSWGIMGYPGVPLGNKTDPHRTSSDLASLPGIIISIDRFK